MIAVNPEGGKLVRVHAVSPQIESGNLYLPHKEIAPWIEDFVEECAVFPNGPYDDQVDAIEALSHCELDTKLVKVYTGYRGSDVLGYAFIDVHNVRTLPEAFLVVLGPQGDVRTLRVLAFHEPLEYKPSDRWYTQFEEKTLDSQLRLGRDVHGIVGATLSARATTRGVRRALALYEVVVQSRR